MSMDEIISKISPYKDDENKKVIDQITDVNKLVDNEGRTILTRILSLDRDGELVEYLISKGADVNAKDKYGITALMYSVNDSHDYKQTLGETYNQASASILANNPKTDLNAEDNNGYTALDYAQNNAMDKIIQNAAARRNVTLKPRTLLAVEHRYMIRDAKDRGYNDASMDRPLDEKFMKRKERGLPFAKQVDAYNEGYLEAKQNAFKRRFGTSRKKRNVKSKKSIKRTKRNRKH